jgi:hypothetical protein
MKKTIINIPSSINYLSEFTEDLPHDCIFDKGKVGAGGTSVAIMNKENYIIAVPFLSLIENKISQNKNLLGVHSKVTDKAILNYLNNEVYPKKIMVTYDSLCRIVDLIEPSEYRLLVDEYHLLFTSYSFRYDACACVLENYTKFKSYCFMTATVLEGDFILKELQHIPIVEYIWEDVEEVTIHSMRCPKSVVPTVSNIIAQYLDGRLEGNAYFFVNSVEFIAEMVKLLQLTDDNTRAVWSVYNKLKVGLKNGNVKNDSKNIRKINFFTSKCFEGVDLYDEDARIYVVSDKSLSHTLLDISTSIQQICGRVRNSKYLKDIAHIFTTTRYDVELNYDQYKEATKEIIEMSIGVAKEYNNLSDAAKNGIIALSNANYVNRRKMLFLYDENMVKIDLYNYKITKCLYRLRINLTKEYKKNNFNVVEHKSLIKESFTIGNSFREVVLECQKGDSDYLLWAFKRYAFLHEAIKYLGYDKIREYDYAMPRVKRAIVAFTDKPEESKIKMLLTNYKFSKGVFVSNEDLKSMFAEIYSQIGISKSPKAKDIETYFKVKQHLKVINKERVNGVVIL